MILPPIFFFFFLPFYFLFFIFILYIQFLFEESLCLRRDTVSGIKGWEKKEWIKGYCNGRPCPCPPCTPCTWRGIGKRWSVDPPETFFMRASQALAWNLEFRVFILCVIQYLISSLPMNPIFKGHKGSKVELLTPDVMYIEPACLPACRMPAMCGPCLCRYLHNRIPAVGRRSRGRRRGWGGVRGGLSLEEKKWRKCRLRRCCADANLRGRSEAWTRR